MTVLNRSNTPHYTWAEHCDGWRLLDQTDLSVIEERMPPNTQESRHTHQYANQLFYVLAGNLVIEVDGICHRLGAHDALNVRPGMVHQVRNNSADDARFLVVSAPSTNGDRQLR